MGTLGRKRICKTCGVAYYDLGKKNHSCPKCNSKATSKTKQLGKNASKEASQKSLELELFEVSEADLSKGKSISSGTIKLFSSNFSPGWYAAAKTDVNGRSLSQDSHALYLGAPPLKGLEVHLSSNIFKGVGAVTSARLVAAHKMNLITHLMSGQKTMSEMLEVNKDILISLFEGWNANPERNILLILLNELELQGIQIREVERSYGASIVSSLNHKPFGLVKSLPRFGFSDAERVCKRLHIEITEEQRVLAATDYYLLDVEQRLRHTCLPEENAHQRVSELLSIAPQKVQEVLSQNKETFAYRQRRNKVVVATKISAERDFKTCSLLKSINEKHKKVGHGTAFDSANMQSGDDINLSDEQIEAINNVINAPVSVITGGPGAGKTTMVQGLVSALKSLKADIRLCAPTGRAAKRISETPGLAKLNPSTIHMFLTKEQSSKSSKDFNVMIVDEASMIDSDLMLDLLQSIPNGASLVFIGDVDQLPPVGPGQPFKDIIESGMVSVSRLTGNFRQSSFSETVKAARQIIRGETPRLHNSISKSDFVFIECNGNKQAETVLDLYFDALPSKLKVSPLDIQILSPQRPGNVGVIRLNELIQQRLTANAKEIFRKKVGNQDVGFFVGDKVIQRKNNYELKVMNGDQGTITRVSGQDLMVEFGGMEIAFDGKQRYDLDLAYATTIHSSQGSEYPGVIIPVVASHTHMLSRNLIYTAVTRGKQQVCLVGEVAAFKKALAQYQKDFRWTALTELLKDVLK